MTSDRRAKPYISVDCDLARNERVMSCADPAGCVGLWAALSGYIRECPLDEPRVLRTIALGMYSGDARNANRLADMVRVGLLDEDATHYIVLRYSPRNQLRKDVERAKKEAKTRMRSVRANKARTNSEQAAHEQRTSALVPTSISISDLSSLPGGAGGAAPASAVPAWERDPFGQQSLAAAFAAGVRNGRGAPITEPTRGLYANLVAAVRAHAPADCRESGAHSARAAWLCERAEAFGRTAPADPSVFAFERWLNAGAPSGPRLISAAIERADRESAMHPSRKSLDYIDGPPQRKAAK